MTDTTPPQEIGRPKPTHNRRCPICGKEQEGVQMHDFNKGSVVYWHKDGSGDACKSLSKEQIDGIFIRLHQGLSMSETDQLQIWNLALNATSLSEASARDRARIGELEKALGYHAAAYHRKYEGEDDEIMVEWHQCNECLEKISGPSPIGLPHDENCATANALKNISHPRQPDGIREALEKLVDSCELIFNDYLKKFSGGILSVGRERLNKAKATLKGKTA